MVIYLLMTLTDIHHWVDETEPILEDDLIRSGQHVIGPIRTGRQPGYSDQLCNLVREYLNPAITKCPTVSRPVTRTRASVERFRTTSRTGRDTTKPPKLAHLRHSQSVLREGQAARGRQFHQGAVDRPYRTCYLENGCQIKGTHLGASSRAQETTRAESGSAPNQHQQRRRYPAYNMPADNQE